MASNLEVILSTDVPHLGHMGQVVKVRKGYARNYLLPRGLALLATQRNLKELEHKKRVIDSKATKLREAARDLAGKLSAISITITRRVSEEDRLYGSVTARDIAESLAEEKVELDYRMIELPEPIKHLGVFNLPVRISQGVDANLKVWVVAEEGEA